MPPLVSVVVPFYNAECFLAECIESVLAQTFEHWELILLNNGSTDSSLAIAERFAARDSRIRIHSNREVLPVNRNHNLALRLLSPPSKYCKVLHADDFMFPECLARMVAVAEDNPTVGIVSSYGMDGVRVRWAGLPHTQTVFAGHEICRATLLKKLYVFGAPSSLLIRSDLVRSRPDFYDEALHPYADVAACYETLRNSDFAFVHQILTFTREHEQSITFTLKWRLGTQPSLQLELLVRYGPMYLTATEYESQLKRNLHNYYRFLARRTLRNVLSRADRREFWAFHKVRMARTGHPFRRAAFFRGLLLEGVNLVLNLERVVRVLRRHLKGIPVASNRDSRANFSEQRTAR